MNGTRSVECRDFSLALARPLSTADGTIRRREGTLLWVVDDGGTGGLGEATPLPGWTESLEECRDALEVAAQALRESGIPEVATGDVPEFGDHSALAAVEETPAARHALTQALLDLEARRCRIPLYRTLGAPEWVRHVPVNGTVGDGTVTHTAQTAVSAIRRGFGCLKVKVGARPVAEDVERLAAIRDVAGEGVVLRADANASWTRKQARRALSELEDRGVGLDYLEQPVVGGDLEGLRELRADHETPVAVDETLVEAPASEVLSADAADVLVCKPMALGGIDRVVAAAAAGTDAGCRTVVTTTIDGVVARTGAVHAAASLEDPPPCGLATADRLAEDLEPDPAPVGAGRITVPQDHGTGPSERWWSTGDG